VKSEELWNSSLSTLHSSLFMSTIIYRVESSPDGTLRLGIPQTAATLNAASALMPDGGYTTLRTYGKSGIIVISHHFDRLEESAALLGHPIALNRSALSTLLCEVLQATPWQESRLRITVDCTVAPGDLWISVEPLPLPDAILYETGVACITRVMHRDNPKAKYTSFITASHAERQLVQGDINDVLMVGENGGILEGLSSNFFAFYRGNLYTAGDGVLPGITRTLILEEAQRASIPVILESPRLAWLSELEEAFISSASRAVLPVVRIDGMPIGNGAPGTLSQRLQMLYQARLEQEIEDVC
jgi:branched-chain amino acid aminotransferase